MTANWTEITLGDFANINPKRPVKKGDLLPYVEMAALPTNSRDIPMGKVESRIFKSSGAKFKNDDTLLARITPCLENGKTALVSGFNGVAFGSTEFIVLEPKEPTDAFFLYYLTRSEDFRSFAISRMEGTSGRQRVPTSTLGHYKFRCPPIEERQRIGKFLSEIDDQIFCLAEQNSNLDGIASSLFKSWFIELDILKHESKAHEYLTRNAPDLIPSGTKQFKNHVIPNEWSLSALYDIADYINGAAYKKFEPNKSKKGLPIIKIAELKSGISPQTGYSDIAMPEKYRITDREILFSWSGNPDTSIDTFVWSHGDAYLNQHIFKVLPYDDFGRAFTVLMLKYLKPIFSEIARDKQTTGLGHVTISDLKKIMIPVPTRKLLSMFNELVEPILEKSFLCTKQMNTLGKIRNIVLNQLILGERRL